jgi:hypothetical protein
MSNQEKIQTGPENNLDAVREAGHAQTEALRQKHEKTGEFSIESSESTSERARAEAKENAISVERESLSKEKAPTPPAVRRGAINKRDLDTTYKRTMSHVQGELSAPSRAFSKVIHTNAVEKASDALEATVARPNAILAGAVAAFIVTLALYLVAKTYGYRLSGFETIGGFVFGWIIGLLFDFFRVMITGKRP